MAKKAKAGVRRGRPPIPATAQEILRNGHIMVRLREELAKREWMPADLSERVSGTRDGVVVYRWLAGKGAPSPEFRFKLVKLFGGSVDDYAPRDPNAIVPEPPHAVMTINGPVPPKRIHRAAAEVFAFTVNEHGMARIKLDVTLPMHKAKPLFNTLLQSGLLPEGSEEDGNPEEENEQ